MLLPRAHVTMQHLLLLGGQLLGHLGLLAPQDERPDHLVQPLNDEQLLLLLYHQVTIGRIGGSAYGAEPLVERRRALEDVRQNEVEQAPQLVEVVLDWRAREQQALARAIVLPQAARQHRLVVLEAVTLIDDQVVPVGLGERGLVAHHEVVVGDDHLKLAAQHLVAQCPALPAVAIIQDNLALGQPALELVAPIGAHRLGGDD
mmetsp:Transcript_13574/g.42695  ORF Transcript_13574/g.42695 Transcript_13574/m.42695 type:complete len:203 (-) Transcript_13574:773-1381(-)